MVYGRLVSDELSGEIAKSYVSQISGFHRIQASAMYHESALYLVDELRRVGLKDANIMQFPADGKRKYWLHRSTIGWKVKSAELRLLEPKEESLASFADVPTSLHTYSQGTKKQGVTAELIDVGVGISSKDYKGKNVKGKIVLAKGSAHDVHNMAVVKRGAAGVITDALTFEFPRVRESIDIPDAHSYQGIWPTSDTAKRTRFGFSLTKRQGNELRGYLAKGKKVKLRAKVDAKLFPGKYDIVTGTIKGSSKPEEEVFLIAHLCHPKPSANDNASGSGLLVEVARTLTALISSGRIDRPARTVRFFWVPETTGTVALLSTREDIRQRLVAGINLDMVGEDQEMCKSTLNVVVTPDSLPSYLDDLVLSVLEDSAKELDHMTKIGLASSFRYVRSPFSAGSDHAEFVEPNVGVPCIGFTQWPDKFYHTSMDTIDKVSTESLRRVGWICAVTVLKLANADFRTGHELASLAYSRGAARVVDASGKASQEIMIKARDSKVKNRVQELSKLLDYHRNRIEHAVQREQDSVRSVRRLADDKDLQAFVMSHVEDLDNAGRREIASLERTARAVEKSLGLKIPRVPKQTKADQEVRKLIPSRHFKGTVPWSDLHEDLGEKRRKVYRKIEDADSDFMSKTAELVNLIDGTRTVYEITRVLSAEYGPTDNAHVLEFLRDLERVGLVSFRKSR